MARGAISTIQRSAISILRSLVCKVRKSNECLSKSEAATLRKIYSGAKDADGKSIFQGYPPGRDSGPATWVLWITGSDPKRTAGTLLTGFGTGYFANMIFDKADWRIDGETMSTGYFGARAASGDRGSAGSIRL